MDDLWTVIVKGNLMVLIRQPHSESVPDYWKLFSKLCYFVRIVSKQANEQDVKNKRNVITEIFFLFGWNLNKLLYPFTYILDVLVLDLSLKLMLDFCFLFAY